MLTVPKPKPFKLGAARLANHIPMGWAENLRLSKIQNSLFMRTLTFMTRPRLSAAGQVYIVQRTIQ
jgi:hypothetical protein